MGKMSIISVTALTNMFFLRGRKDFFLNLILNLNLNYIEAAFYYQQLLEK